MEFFYLASNGVYLIPPETDDRMGFLTTNILTMFVLLALIVVMIPTPATKEDSPLVVTIYECSVGLFIIQYLFMSFTASLFAFIYMVILRFVGGIIIWVSNCRPYNSL